MSTERRKCIVDANILLDFYEGQCIEHLFLLPVDLVTSDIVVYEVRFSLPKPTLCSLGLIIEELEEEQVTRISSIRQEHEELSIQDISVFILAEEFKAHLISGDETLRDFGNSNNLECHGTIWYLDELVRLNLISPLEAASDLRNMLGGRHPRRLPTRECEKFIRKWETMKRPSRRV